LAEFAEPNLHPNNMEEETVTDETLEVETEVVEDNEELTKAQELAKNQKIRAEKAEKELKELKSQNEKEAPQGDLSQKDLLSIVRADVHDDDIDEVRLFAKSHNIEVAEALKDRRLKAILSDNAEVRKSAEATSVKPARNGAPKVSPEVIVAQASKGGENIPKAGTAEAEALFWARRGGKR
jgi:uncharacterized protein (DUF3084 family)